MMIKKNVLSRYAYHTIPLTLMGATFAVVSNSVLRMRDKDDLFNYFIGNHYFLMKNWEYFLLTKATSTIAIDQRPYIFYTYLNGT